ncbi:2-keto-3-deoxygluconate permease [Paeniglutamicibacter sp. ABSL32-1]|uniref:2-keto-3-deoxygluconate permease n=1 Tax=Paeniglutamicibacter quisquiliarum TaxID=2849498 RepID=UPI001C2CE60D|nr:2-keto-3-deoxygluconate permease [Paeniglutamicibacter quisquiliarum]MBV1781061.1 2-keto-3-deoxygluconate permease [Paeniglutamicibacter quisquiliarum]
METATPATTRRSNNSLERIGSLFGKIPGASMVIPLFLGAIVNTFFPHLLDVGNFTTALFRDGTGALLGLFFFCMGAQLDFRTTGVTLEKGFAILIGKVGIGVAVGLAVAFWIPGGMLFGLLPLAIIAAMTNSNSALYVALMKQFGNTSDRAAVSVISLNDGPFFTLIALGAAGLAAFPAEMLVGLLIPLALGFVLGNVSPKARAFLAPGETLLIPFLGFAVGRGIDFGTLGVAGMQGILLGLMTVVLSGGAAMFALWLVHVLRRRPKPARNLIAGAGEATTAGNAIATPAAIALVDPTYQSIQALATAQIAAATITTAILIPFIVVLVSRWQLKRNISPANEDTWNLHKSFPASTSPPVRDIDVSTHPA